MQLIKGDLNGKPLYKLKQEEDAAALRPHRTLGLKFLATSIIYGVFYFCVIYVMVHEREAEKSYLLGEAFRNRIGSAVQSVSTLGDLERFFLDKLPDMFGRWAVSSDDGIAGIRDNIILGGIAIEQQRGLQACDPAVQALIPESICRASAPDGTTLAVGSDSPVSTAPVFVGPRTGVQFPYLVRSQEDTCPAGYICETGTVSQFHYPEYPYGGYTMAFYNGSYYVGSKNFTVSNSSALIEDFIDLETRFLRIVVVALNPQYSIFLLLRMVFELPPGGGIFPRRPVIDFFPFQDKDMLYNAANIFSFVYSAAWLMVLGGRIFRKVREKRPCPVCHMKNDSILVGSCWNCGKCLLITEEQAGKCRHCLVKSPPLTHKCWREVVFHKWNIAKFIIIVFLIIARAIISISRDKVQLIVRNLAGDIFVGSSSSPPASILNTTSSVDVGVVDAAEWGGPTLPFFDPILSLYNIASSLGAINAIFLSVHFYRMIGVAGWSAKFISTFATGGSLIMLFFLSFFFVFFGFAFTFYLLLGETSEQFFTITEAMSSTFSAFMGVLSWRSVEYDDRKWLLSIMYVTFCWICVLVSLNILISLVTVEYKEAKRRRHYDIEAESVKLLFRAIFSKKGEHLTQKALKESELGIHSRANKEAILKKGAKQSQGAQKETAVKTMDDPRHVNEDSSAQREEEEAEEREEPNHDTMDLLHQMEQDDPLFKFTDQIGESISGVSASYKENYSRIADNIEVLTEQVELMAKVVAACRMQGKDPSSSSSDRHAPSPQLVPDPSIL